MRSFDIIIVGAGHGGAQAGVQLRQLGFTGSIAIIGDEPELPYERPPLSKEYLAREKPFDCAGGFKAEGLGISLFENIDSRDPTALLGLPLIWLASALRSVGYTLP